MMGLVAETSPMNIHKKHSVEQGAGTSPKNLNWFEMAGLISWSLRLDFEAKMASLHDGNCHRAYMSVVPLFVLASKPYRPLHEWCLYLNTYTFYVSHSCEKSFVWKYEYKANEVQSIVIQI